MIPMLVSDWKIERGVAQAHDVAMTTKERRVALRGGLDFVNERFNDVTGALIDARGCAEVRQKIRGPFLKPVVDKPNILTSLAGPALKLLRKGSKFFPGNACDVFYAGLVVPPK
jgi:AsmA protein